MLPNQRKTVTLEEMTYSNMLAVNAVVELFDEKGIISKAEVMEPIRKLQLDAHRGRPS
jgi:hypothetical protein